MSNSYRTLDGVRARDAMLASGHGPLPSPVPINQYDAPQPFTEMDWREEAKAREFVDMFVLSMRWQVTVCLSGDRKPWVAFWCGEHAECLRRAQYIFKNPLSVTLEPAGISGGEVADRWFPIVTRSIAL